MPYADIIDEYNQTFQLYEVYELALVNTYGFEKWREIYESTDDEVRAQLNDIGIKEAIEFIQETATESNRLQNRLNEIEAEILYKVYRLKIGDVIETTNNQGRVVKAMTITRVSMHSEENSSIISFTLYGKKHKKDGSIGKRPDNYSLPKHDLAEGA